MPLALIELPFASLPLWVLALVLLAGFAGLAFGGDWLTSGAAAISVNLQISPVVVGLTVVSMATSMPELMTSLLAAKDSPGIAIGNIVGSNVANSGLILGVTAIIAPLAVRSRLIRREMPFLVVVTVLFTYFAWAGFVRIEGLILLVLTVGFLVYIVRTAKRDKDALAADMLEEVEKASRLSSRKAAGILFVGTLALALGADLLVGGSVELASRFGVSDALIGLTIVAIGTSLPELAASVAAARSGHSDICAGNIVGSNLFNLMLIGGSVATITPFPVDATLFRVEFPAMLLFTVLLLWFFKSGHIVSRAEGVVLLLLYVLVLSLSGAAQMGYLF
ncbi:MAG: calcium/sodium antiporter [Opitutales bacterium]